VVSSVQPVAAMTPSKGKGKQFMDGLFCSPHRDTHNFKHRHHHPAGRLRHSSFHSAPTTSLVVNVNVDLHVIDGFYITVTRSLRRASVIERPSPSRCR
jgi:hypothetical protein